MSNMNLYMKWWLFNRYTCPFLEPVRNPIHVRFLIQLEDSQPAAGLAMLVVHNSVVPATGISSNPDCYEFAAPTVLSAPVVIAYELSHNTRLVIFFKISVHVVIEPRRSYPGSDGFGNPLMQLGKRE
jgi:hypothetical protein